MFPILLILLFIVSFFGTLIVRKTASKTNIIDIPNIRSLIINLLPEGLEWLLQ